MISQRRAYLLLLLEGFASTSVQMLAIARQFILSVSQDNQTYNAVVIDLYSNHTTIAEHVSTIEFHRLVNGILSKNGVVLINVIGSSKLDSEYSRVMDSTIRATYRYCRMQAVQESELANLFYACTKRQDSPIPVFSDDDTRASILAVEN